MATLQTLIDKHFFEKEAPEVANDVRASLE